LPSATENKKNEFLKEKETVVDLMNKTSAVKNDESVNYENLGLFGKLKPWGIALFISIIFSVLSAIFIRKIGF